MKAFIRRNWLRAVVYGSLVYCAVDPFLIEPHWIKITRMSLAECFRKTHGDWLADRAVVAVGGKLLIVGGSVTTNSSQRAASERDITGNPGVKRILLTHYPAVVDSIKDENYDLILAGHSHGGQVRLPFFGALIVPSDVKKYQMGTYLTPAGRLHVSSGLGTYWLPVRFFCRPEITVIEL